MSRRWTHGNDWSALDGVEPVELPIVSVIIAHYDQQSDLDRTLAALAAQDYPLAKLQVIVADDGSPRAPRVPLGIELVRQADRGFRLAAVRNLGAASARGEILCFIDADCAPEPGYVRAAVRLPSLLPEAVVVGRRRHARLDGKLGPIAVIGPRHELSEPGWLLDAYRSSADLLDADDRSYRFIIGASITTSRWFFDEVGGFDERFQSYGGEDWEWAHRAWNAGAILAHERRAVLWHNGPEYADREDEDAAAAAERQNPETLVLSQRINVPGSAGRAVLGEQPHLQFVLDGEHDATMTFVTVDSLLELFPSAQIVVPEGSAQLFPHDPRIVPPRRRADAASIVCTVHGPVRFHEGDAPVLVEALDGLRGAETRRIDLVDAHGRMIATAMASRTARRESRWGSEAVTVERRALASTEMLRRPIRLAGHLGRW